MWRDGLHTFVADKLPEESLVTPRDVCVLDLVSALFVFCGEKAEGIEQELATLLADLRPSRGMAWRFCRALMIGSGRPLETTPSWTKRNSATS